MFVGRTQYVAQIQGFPVTVQLSRAGTARRTGNANLWSAVSSPTFVVHGSERERQGCTLWALCLVVNGYVFLTEELISPVTLFFSILQKLVFFFKLQKLTAQHETCGYADAADKQHAIEVVGFVLGNARK